LTVLRIIKRRDEDMVKLVLVGMKSAWIPDAGIKCVRDVAFEVSEEMAESLLSQGNMYKIYKETKKESEAV